MALIIEDGSIVAGANSYASLSVVDAYHAARGKTEWAGDDVAKEAAILRAMDWLEALPFLGAPTKGAGMVGISGYQDLQWPRAGFAWGTDVIPGGLVRALCEAALVELQSPGGLAPELERGGMVKQETVDVLTTVYMDGAPFSTTRQQIMQHLRGLIGSSNVITLVR